MEQTAQSANSTMAGTATRWMQLTDNVLSVLMNIEKNHLFQISIKKDLQHKLQTT